MTPETKSLTVRIPPELYQSASDAARRRRVSLNALVQEGLAALVRQEQDAALYESFSLLGEDAAEGDVEFAFAAQREAVHGDA